MRIGLVVEQLRRAVPGGIGTYARGLVQGLAQLEGEALEVVLLASRPSSRPDPLAALGPPVRASRLPAPLAGRAWHAGLVPDVDGLDVVHAVSLALPPTGRVPAVACIHDLAWRCVPETFPPRARRWHEAALARTLRRGRRFIVPSTATADALTWAGAPPGTVRVVEEGCDHLALPDWDRARARLAEAGVDGPYLLSVGTLEPRKNLSRLLQAFARAQPRLPEPWPLVVVGPRGWGPTVAPQPGVILLGEAGAGVLSGLYSAARCLAYVPLLEGWGLPAIEAMAVGTPVVASPMPSTAGQALEVDPRDIDGMADAIVAAATDEELRSDLVAKGKARASGLTWARAARAHVQVWEEAA
jgi:glycosyltransferase involved in cell wall biosynthesis